MFMAAGLCRRGRGIGVFVGKGSVVVTLTVARTQPDGGRLQKLRASFSRFLPLWRWSACSHSLTLREAEQAFIEKIHSVRHYHGDEAW